MKDVEPENAKVSQVLPAGVKSTCHWLSLSAGAKILFIEILDFAILIRILTIMISEILLKSAEFMKDLTRVPESTLRKTFLFYWSFVNIIFIGGIFFFNFSAGVVSGYFIQIK